MKSSYWCLLFLLLSGKTFTQVKQTKLNNTPFTSVFQALKQGKFTGTANGVLFVKTTDGKDVIMDFQGSVSRLDIENDSDEVYDVSEKKYQAKTTSGRSGILYNIYANANEFIVQLPQGDFQIGLIDGASDEVIKDLKYYYKSEKETEYLVLSIEKELRLSNFWYLLKQSNYDDKQLDACRKNEKFITLLPHSVIVLAMKR